MRGCVFSFVFQEKDPPTQRLFRVHREIFRAFLCDYVFFFSALDSRLWFRKHNLERQKITSKMPYFEGQKIDTYFYLLKVSREGYGSWTPAPKIVDLSGSHRSTHITSDLASRVLASQAKPQRESESQAFRIARS